MGLRRREIADLYDRRYVGFRNALATITRPADGAELVRDPLGQQRLFRSTLKRRQRR